MPEAPAKVSRVYGWRPDKPDQRDQHFRPRATLLPGGVDLRGNCPPVYDQGQLGSCTGNSIAGDIEYMQKKEKIPFFIPSRLFIYFNERTIEHTVKTDAGAEIRDGIKAVNKWGVCPETLWPYDIAKFADKPPKNCFDDAALHKTLQYRRVDNTKLDDIRTALAAGMPVVFGFTVYESFESDAVAKTGKVPMPSSSEEVLGGHAVLCVGYDNAKKVFIVRNSWGAEWGDKGYCYMPYAYLTNVNLASDFWVIQQTD